MKKAMGTPGWVDSLIDNLAPDSMEEEIRGDLYELFLKDIRERGPASARRRYAVNALGFLTKSFFWRKSGGPSGAFIMAGSYMRMARRSLSAHKGTAIINTLGLVTGIASVLVILTVVRFELTFDRYHTDADRIYRLVRVSGKDNLEFRTGISYPVPSAIKEAIPAMEEVVSVEYMGAANIDVLDQSGTSVRKFREEAGVALVEQGFFDVFDFRGTDFKWIGGNPANALKDPFTVVLTKTMARKYFGDTSPLGQSLRFQKKYDCKVTGIIEDLPANTEFPFTILVSYESMRVLAGEAGMGNWYSVEDAHNTFVVAAAGVTPAEIESAIAKVHAAHTPAEIHGMRRYLLQPLKDIHYDARFHSLSGRTISRETLAGLGIVAVFLLLTGSINYVNLSTAQSVLRAREIGLRKVLGSSRSQLILQFLLETFLLVFCAGVLAILLSEIMLVNLQSILNIRMDHYHFLEPLTLLYWLAIIVVVTLFAGLYPSLMISHFNPIAAIRSKFGMERAGGISLRKMLVVFQFTITQMLVVGTFIVVSQMRYFHQQDMGFNREAVLTAKISDMDPLKRRAMESQLREQAFVSHVSFSYTSPSGVVRNRAYLGIGKPDAASLEDYRVFEFAAVDTSYLGLYGIPLLAGRNLLMSDTTGNILINKTLCRNLGFDVPVDAIGRELKIGGGEHVTVVGVVDDYYSNSLKEGVDNIVMLIREENFSTLNVKLNVTGDRGSLAGAVKKIEKIWQTTYPEFVFTYNFLDENIKAFYAQEEKYSRLFQLFSLVFLLIACLGLYGLITFVVNRKGREVAIRKVLGATLANIMVMFSSEYVRLIFISFLLAAPAAYYVVNAWLSNFANHIALHWWVFVVPGMMVLTIALVVIVSRALGAANANPVEKLRCE